MKPSEAIKQLRRSGLTEQAIGQMVGARQSTINRIRHEKVTPNWEVGEALVRLALRIRPEQADAA